MSWDNILEDLARSSPGQLPRGSFRSRIQPRSWRWIGRSSALSLLILGAMSLWGQRAAEEESGGEPECEHAAQAETKAFRGVVSDPSGAGISGAGTAASCGSYRQTATTDSGGAFSW